MIGAEIFPIFHEHLIVYEKIHSMPGAEFSFYEDLFSKFRSKGQA